LKGPVYLSSSYPINALTTFTIVSKDIIATGSNAVSAKGNRDTSVDIDRKIQDKLKEVGGNSLSVTLTALIDGSHSNISSYEAIDVYTTIRSIKLERTTRHETFQRDFEWRTFSSSLQSRWTRSKHRSF
jgi:hypothetical protein